MPECHVVILAAGKGKRMKSRIPKVLHEAAGLPLIDYVLRTAVALHPSSIIVVIGHDSARVEERVGKRPGLQFARQEPQLGTGHALLQAEPALRGRSGTLVLLSGDVPLLRPDTVRGLVAHHEARGAAATVLTASVDDPAGYGRIVREGERIRSIVEDQDASPSEKEVREINTGIYAFELPLLFDALQEIGTANAQGEYYLPDLVRIYVTRGLAVETVAVGDLREIKGVNSRKELAEVAGIIRRGKNEELMSAGVTIMDPATTWIGADVTIGSDTIVHPGVHLEGRTHIGQDCEIHSGVRVVDTEVGNGVTINNFCVITESRIRDGARIGPFAHVRPQSDVGPDAHIGNFVELKKTTLGRGSKANHLAYLGDATIGEKVNVGAGAITCNYDGITKHPTVIEDGAFIGSDSQLIAPVRVGRGAYVAAGSSITEDVPADALAIARGTQVTKEGWAGQRKKKS